MPEFGFEIGALAWLFTYALHSTLLLAAAWLLTSSRLGRIVRSERARETIWKTALVGINWKWNHIWNFSLPALFSFFLSGTAL